MTLPTLRDVHGPPVGVANQGEPFVPDGLANVRPINRGEGRRVADGAEPNHASGPRCIGQRTPEAVPLTLCVSLDHRGMRERRGPVLRIAEGIIAPALTAVLLMQQRTADGAA